MLDKALVGKALHVGLFTHPRPRGSEEGTEHNQDNLTQGSTAEGKGGEEETGGGGKGGNGKERKREWEERAVLNTLASTEEL